MANYKSMCRRLDELRNQCFWKLDALLSEAEPIRIRGYEDKQGFYIEKNRGYGYDAVAFDKGNVIFIDGTTGECKYIPEMDALVSIVDEIIERYKPKKR